MSRTDQLRRIADLLHRAAAMARDAARHGDDGQSRESALATQVEGIAAEFEVLVRAEQRR